MDERDRTKPEEYRHELFPARELDRKPKTAAQLFPVKTSKEESRKLADARHPAWGVYNKATANSIINRHKVAIERAKAVALDQIWDVGQDHKLNRYEMMEMLVVLVGEGYSLPAICKDPSMPTLAEVRAWGKRHPDFTAALKDANETRGMIMGEQALNEVMDHDPSETGAAKLKFEALTKTAARLNNEFKEKAVIQVEDITEHWTEDQIKERLELLMKNCPDIKTLADKAFGNTPQDTVYAEQMLPTDAEIVNE